MTLTRLKSRCRQSWFYPESPGENPFLFSSSFWRLLIAPWSIFKTSFVASLGGEPWEQWDKLKRGKLRGNNRDLNKLSTRNLWDVQVEILKKKKKARWMCESCIQSWKYTLWVYQSEVLWGLFRSLRRRRLSSIVQWKWDVSHIWKFKCSGSHI